MSKRYRTNTTRTCDRNAAFLLFTLATFPFPPTDASASTVPASPTPGGFSASHFLTSLDPGGSAAYSQALAFTPPWPASNPNPNPTIPAGLLNPKGTFPYTLLPPENRKSSVSENPVPFDRAIWAGLRGERWRVGRSDSHSPSPSIDWAKDGGPHSSSPRTSSGFIPPSRGGPPRKTLYPAIVSTAFSGRSAGFE